MITATVYIEPMGKPRMTRRDKWAERDCVQRYWAFKDKLKYYVTNIPRDCSHVSWTAYLPIPPSWSKKKREQMAGQPHRQKPDRDNIDKAILDALFGDDAGIATGSLSKFWDDGRGPRIELEMS